MAAGSSAIPVDAADAPLLSVVVACYNEELGLDELHRRVTAVCDALGRSYEIVLVNDGSKDGTWVKLADLAGRDPRVVAVNLSRNHGHQLALTAGLTLCRGRRVLIIDADLQDPPELLPQMMQMMDGGADVVYGQRVRRAGETRFKLLSAAMFYWLIHKLTETHIPPNAGDFRLISRRALGVLLAMPERHRFMRGLVSWVGFRQEPIRYERDPRFAGQTGYPVRRMLRLAMDAVTAFSIKPLQFASILGFIMSLVAVCILIYALVSWLTHDTAQGWTSMVGAMALLGGVQLFVLGIIGEYVGRIYEQVKGRPLFVIEQVVRSPAPGIVKAAAQTSGAGAGGAA